MKIALITVWMLGSVGVLAASSAQAEPAAASPPPKASALAPRGHSANHTYGTPIQPRILNHLYRKPRRVPPAGASHR